ncbi:MAG TPA: hypothetical protein VEK15_17410 [Vicinamibacteria bacterium]|nr:hypothetical protein [Vicinamibacteria bacterium]
MGNQIVERSPFVEKVARQLRHALTNLAESYAERGRSLEDLGTAEEIANRMLATVPAPSDWDDLLGPFYSTSRVAKLLGDISRQAIAERRERRTLLGLRTEDGSYVYPTFQFDAHNDVLSGLAEVLQCFDPKDVDEWTVAGWLVASQRSLGGRSVIEALASRGPRQDVVELARAQAARFAQ